MHSAVIAQLRCPVCQGSLVRDGRSVRCDRMHSFDQARQGYVDLTAGRSTHAGDTAQMVAARQALLGAGHFDPVSAVVSGATKRVLTRYSSGMIVDVGAGTGHYLASVLDGLPGYIGLAVDVSKPALRRAARAHPRMAAVRADVWDRLPVRDGAARAVLNIFAPRSGGEFARILAPGGALVVVTAEPGHLAELVDALDLLAVDPDKRERLAATLEPWFTLESDETLDAALRLTRPEAAALVAMGPSARHVTPAQVEARLPKEPVKTTIQIRLTVWRPATA